MAGRTPEQKRERLELLGEQTRLTENHCKTCTATEGLPWGRSEVRDICNACEIGQRLLGIGIKLNGLRGDLNMISEVKSYKMSPEELEDYRVRTGYKSYTNADGVALKQPVQDKSARNVRPTTAEPDKTAFLKSIADGKTIAATEKSFGMKPNSIYAWLKKWGLTGIKPEKARELLGIMEPEAQEPVIRDKKLPGRVPATVEVLEVKDEEIARLRKALEGEIIISDQSGAAINELKSEIDRLKEKLKEEGYNHDEALRLLNETKHRLNEAQDREEMLQRVIAERESEIEMLLQPHEEFPTASDSVSHPNHYTAGGIETIDIIRAKMTSEMFEGYCLGNVIKYTTRYRFKNGVEDMRKAEQYLRWMIEAAAIHVENKRDA